MPHRRMSLKEVSDYLHVKTKDVEELARHNEIPHTLQGGKPFFIRREIDAWASQRILGLPRARLEKYHQGTSASAHDLSIENAVVTELLRAQAVEPHIAARTKPSLMREMVTLAERTGLVYEPRELLSSLQERELLCSTGLPEGLALLHPRHHDQYMAADSFVALGRTAARIPFGAPDGQGSDLFFLLCCQDDRIHLHVLARLCMMCMQTKLIPRLREAADVAAMRAAVEECEREVIAGLNNG